MTHRFHLQCQLLWIVGDFLEGHVKGILGLRPGSVGKRWMADYRGLPKEGRMSRRMAGAGEKNGGEKKKLTLTLKAHLSHFIDDEIKSQKTCPKLSRHMVLERRLELPSLKSHLLAFSYHQLWFRNNYF